MACNHSYGKLPVVKALAQRNLKGVTLCHAVGSQHSIVGSTTIDAKMKKWKEAIRTEKSVQDMSDNDDNEKNGDEILESNKNDFLEAVIDFVICDEEAVLLGPEIKVAHSTTIPTLHAVAFRDIFDKRLCQINYGFTLVALPK